MDYKFKFKVDNVTCYNLTDPIPYMDCVEMEKEIMVINNTCTAHPRVECKQEKHCDWVDWKDMTQSVDKTNPQDVVYKCPFQPPKHKKRCFLPGDDQNPQGKPSPLGPPNDLLTNLDITLPQGAEPGNEVIKDILPKGAKPDGLNVDGLWINSTTGEVVFKPLVNGDPFQVG